MATKSLSMRSRAIEAAEWDDDTYDLTIVFVGRRGAVYYLYPNVGPDLIQDWMEAKSQGQYFHAYIKQLSSRIVNNPYK